MCGPRCFDPRACSCRGRRWSWPDLICVPGATFFNNSEMVTGIHLKNRRDAATMRALSFHIGSQEWTSAVLLPSSLLWVRNGFGCFHHVVAGPRARLLVVRVLALGPNGNASGPEFLPGMVLKRYVCSQLQNSRVEGGGWGQERCVGSEDTSGRVEVVLRSCDAAKVGSVGDIECFKHQSQRRTFPVERDIACKSDISGSEVRSRVGVAADIRRPIGGGVGVAIRISANRRRKGTPALHAANQGELIAAQEIAGDRVLQRFAVVDVPNAREYKAMPDIGVAAAAFQVGSEGVLGILAVVGSHHHGCKVWP